MKLSPKKENSDRGAKALIGLGHDALLVPMYTPIRTDEAEVSNAARQQNCQEFRELGMRWFEPLWHGGLLIEEIFGGQCTVSH